MLELLGVPLSGIYPRLLLSRHPACSTVFITADCVRCRGCFIAKNWFAILKQGLLGQFAQMGSEIEDSSPLCRCGEVVQQCGIPALTSSGFQQCFHRCGKGVVRTGSIYGAHAPWLLLKLGVNTPWMRSKSVKSWRGVDLVFV